MKPGFTLLELIVVVIIIGILATLGFTQYTKVIEKGRGAEAKTILGTLRTAQQAYLLEYGFRTATITNLGLDVATVCAAGSAYYFTYATTDTSGTATRCTASGKLPVGPAAYEITLTYTTGVWSGSAGYY